MNDKWSFIYSTGFWAVVIISISTYLADTGVITEALKLAIWTLAGGFTTIRTLDKTIDKIAPKYEEDITN